DMLSLAIFHGGRMRTWVGFCFLLFTVSCGSGPKFRVDDQLLYDVPVAEKQGVLGAEAEIAQAREERNKAMSDVIKDGSQLSMSDWEYGQAKLEVSKVEAELNLANQSRDINRINPAKEQLKLAKMGKQVAAAKYDWLKMRRKGHKAQLDVADRHIDLAQARYE